MVVPMHICTHIYLHPCISTQYIHQYLTISGNGENSIPIPNTTQHHGEISQTNWAPNCPAVLPCAHSCLCSPACCNHSSHFWVWSILFAFTHLQACGWSSFFLPFIMFQPFNLLYGKMCTIIILICKKGEILSRASWSC